MGLAKVQIEVGEDKVAILTIDNPPVNSLSNAVFNGLYKGFQEVVGQADIRAVVITGAHGVFCGGADIRRFQRKQNAEEESEKTILAPLTIVNKVIEGCEKPVVAALEGFALGGGLELAMACHARVAAEGTKFGLPELQLGIIPGLGGTQRLPRLVGLEKALDMLLTSKAISAQEARDCGLVDAVTESPSLLFMARKQAMGMVHSQKPWNVSLHQVDKIGNAEATLVMLAKARTAAKRKFRNVTYPFMCLDVVEEGLRKGGEAGTELENRTSRALVKTFEARALMHIFFAKRSSFKVPGVASLGLRGRPIQKVAVVGCGFMGSGIATALLAKGIPVVLKDINVSCLEQSINMIKENLQGLMRKGRMTEMEAQKSLALVTTTESYDDFGSLDLVVETVIEELSLKRRVFGELDRVCSPYCILASNTSSLDIDIIGGDVSHPGRFVGAHFFSPAYVMELLEVVRTSQTSPQTVLDMIALARTLRKVPLVVKSAVGFAANRLFVPYIMMAILLVDLGLDPYHIDTVLREFGMPMGPFRVLDFTGIKTFHLVSQMFCEKWPERFHKSPLISLLLKDNRHGDSTKSGFYDYESSGEVVRAPSLRKYLEASRQLVHAKCAWADIQVISDREIIEMILFGVVNEACRIMEDNVVTEPASLDIASVLGMGFPSYRGGIIFWADSFGPAYILNQVQQWRQHYGDVYKPSSLLERCATSGAPLGQSSRNPSKL